MKFIERILSQLETILIITIMAVFVLVAGLYVWWIGPVLFRRKALTGREALVGKEGTVVSDVTLEDGEVNVDGIIWKATSAGDSEIPVGERIVVTGVSSLTLIVRKKLEE